MLTLKHSKFFWEIGKNASGTDQPLGMLDRERELQHSNDKYHDKNKSLGC